MPISVTMKDYEYFDGPQGRMICFDLPEHLAAEHPQGLEGSPMAFFDPDEKPNPILRLAYPGSGVLFLFEDVPEPLRQALLEPGGILLCQAGGGDFLRAAYFGAAIFRGMDPSA